jgi:FlaA1/EpsC-like NDP-sugar epimerase
VIGSSGSVVPLFREQIASGGPVTVTDERMTRYFMSVREAAELIIQAGALSNSGDTLLLEMGEPVRIMDLAVDMILLGGLTVRDEDNPGGDIAIEIIGAGDGEKLYEELFTIRRARRPLCIQKFCVVVSKMAKLPQKRQRCLRSCMRRSRDATRQRYAKYSFPMSQHSRSNASKAREGRV